MNKKIIHLLKNYYKPHNQLYLEKLQEKHTSTLSKKENAYIKKLETKFKKLVISRNNFAKTQGYLNYFEYSINQNAIPQKELKSFFSEVYTIGKKIINDLPIGIKESEWFDGTRYGFNLSHINSASKYKLPKDIKKFILQQKNINPKLLEKIELKHSSRITFTTRYYYKNIKAKIYFNKNRTDILGAKLLAHEYGHALGMLKGVEKNNECKYPKPYPDEKRAIKMEMKFIKTLKEHDRKILNFGLLHHFINTLFESKIYKDPSRNFAKLYAQIQDKMLGKKIKGGKDTTYLFNSFFIEYPCYSTNYSTIYTTTLSLPHSISTSTRPLREWNSLALPE